LGHPDLQHEIRVIILAIAPGVRTLAYSVLRVQHDTLRGCVIDSDVLHHTARGFKFDTLPEQIARARVHWLVLSIWLEREKDAVIVLGPPADRRENPNYVEACRRTIRTAAVSMAIPLLEYETEEEVQTEVGLRSRRLFDRVREIVPITKPPRGVLLATAAGVAGAAQLLELRIDVVSREKRSSGK
jgi:hypothetical protein